MSRPSRAEEQDLEDLEGLVGVLVDCQHALGVLSIRMRQIKRRGKGDGRMLAVVGPAGVELARLADNVDDMHETLAALLARKQTERTTKNRGGSQDENA